MLIPTRQRFPQQSVINTQLAGKDTAAAVALSLALPGVQDCIRLFDGFGAIPTAVGKTTRELVTNWQLPIDGEGTAFTGGFLFRDAVGFAILNDSNPGNKSYKYDWLFSEMGNSVLLPHGQTTAVQPISGLLDPINSTFSPHDNILPAAYDEGDNYLWADSDNLDTGPFTTYIIVRYFDVTNTVPIIPAAGTVPVSLVNNQDSEDVYGAVITADGLNNYTFYPLLNPGDYRLQIANDDTAHADICVRVSTCFGPSAFVAGLGPNNPPPALVPGHNVWAHHMAPSVEKSLQKIDAYRIHGGALKVMNAGAALFRNGTFAVAQFGPGQDWAEVLTLFQCDQSLYDYLTTVNRNVVKEAETGLYGILKPSQLTDFKWINDIEKNADDTQAAALYKISRRAPWIAFCASVQVSDDLGNPQTTTEIFSNFEYQTTDMLTNTDLATVPLATFIEACKLVAHMDQWYDNPKHIMGVFESIAEYGGPLCNTFADILSGINDETVQAIARSLKQGCGLIAPAARIGGAIASNFLATGRPSGSQPNPKRGRLQY